MPYNLLTQLHQALLNEEEKRKQSKSKASGGGGTDDGESALQHNKSDRDPVKCYGCGEEGHMIRNCPQRKSTQAHLNI